MLYLQMYYSMTSSNIDTNLKVYESWNVMKFALKLNRTMNTIDCLQIQMPWEKGNIDNIQHTMGKVQVYMPPLGPMMCPGYLSMESLIVSSSIGRMMKTMTETYTGSYVLQMKMDLSSIEGNEKWRKAQSHSLVLSIMQRELTQMHSWDAFTGELISITIPRNGLDICPLIPSLFTLQHFRNCWRKTQNSCGT